jgi:uncharacterized membrane protein YedE/YeeE
VSGSSDGNSSNGDGSGSSRGGSGSRLVVAFASGLLFAVGLAVAGMTDPSKVIAFLDVTGRRVPWDPALALVMMGAIAAYASAYWWSRRALRRPLLADRFTEPRSGIEGRLLGGAALFGVGWGLAGYCPGPAVVSLATGSAAAFAFCAAMAAGFWITRRVDR